MVPKCYRELSRQVVKERERPQMLFPIGGNSAIAYQPSYEGCRHRMQILSVVSDGTVERTDIQVPLWGDTQPYHVTIVPSEFGEVYVLVTRSESISGAGGAIVGTAYAWTSLWILALDTLVWRQVQYKEEDLWPSGRVYPSCGVIDGRLILVGGVSGEKIVPTETGGQRYIQTHASDCWTMDTETLQWERLSNLGLQSTPPGVPVAIRDTLYWIGNTEAVTYSTRCGFRTEQTYTSGRSMYCGPQWTPSDVIGMMQTNDDIGSITMSVFDTLSLFHTATMPIELQDDDSNYWLSDVCMVNPYIMLLLHNDALVVAEIENDIMPIDKCL
ncbi:hypothetical protein KIPB_005012 [Kipferlia bialata]|uniref:Uncharacterized protein n=1 Tax=Kipferlia bialata TaxID=797122 RepID=A0A9K3CUN5_9EUKA|nr:hypothetical protein KIPB_005012 [Kipferlia bialata]|eukprot:g5012.t1